MQPSETDPLLTPAQVAGMFGVTPKTVRRWANTGLIKCVRTAGGPRRYRESEARALYEASQPAA